MLGLTEPGIEDKVVPSLQALRERNKGRPTCPSLDFIHFAQVESYGNIKLR